MSNLPQRAWVTIDRAALKKNLSRVRALCPDSEIIPVIKADAYGHGMTQVALAIDESNTLTAGFAVATIDEALQLHALGLDKTILLLPGFANDEELSACMDTGIVPVIHSAYQVSALQKEFEKDFFAGERCLWLKHNSGMNRLGLNDDECIDAFNALHKCPDIEVVLMSHLAFADDVNESASSKFTQTQLSKFDALYEKLAAKVPERIERSMAASAGILSLPQSRYQYVRPGIMLYGSSPLANETGEELDLLPVMTFCSRLIAINELKAGDSIGYGADFTCDRDTRVGVVSVGYGDGYPRSAQSGTPVLVNSVNSFTRTRLIGRVSMDMITIDLTAMEQVQVGDEVVLWGRGLCADEVARMSGTIAYELFCRVNKRVEFEYVG